MKMSERNFKRLQWLYDYLKENAGDEEMEAIFIAVGKMAELMVEKQKGQHYPVA